MAILISETPRTTQNRPETAIGFIWVAAALVALVPATLLLQASFPIFTVVWLAVPLVALVRSRDAQRIGLRAIPLRDFARVTALCLGGMLLAALALEPWSHAYQQLITLALSSPALDTTFAWLVRLSGPGAWVGLATYSGLVTIFAEELFFRGWLLQLLSKHMRSALAIVLQATLFTLPQLLAALALGPLQGAVYALGYSWLTVGLIGGWAAARTKSIYPSLLSATLLNLVLTALTVHG